MRPGFFNSIKSIKFANSLLSNSAPHEPRCFLASVFERLQQNRAAASCAADQPYPGRTCAKQNPHFLRPASTAAHQVSPPLSTRRLAGARYQLDFELAQAGIVGNGRHQEDPVVRSCDRYPHTDAIILSKRDNPACAQNSEACRSVASGSSSNSAAGAVGA